MKSHKLASEIIVEPEKGNSAQRPQPAAGRKYKDKNESQVTKYYKLSTETRAARLAADCCYGR